MSLFSFFVIYFIFENCGKITVCFLCPCVFFFKLASKSDLHDRFETKKPELIHRFLAAFLLRLFKQSHPHGPSICLRCRWYNQKMPNLVISGQRCFIENPMFFLPVVCCLDIWKALDDWLLESKAFLLFECFRHFPVSCLFL